ncbi:MAG TPA: CocE/NonD family hydrolase [Umezawaea sp.]|nr:CocE/NonD family hydrolase [Umezawaea sp.]
MIVTMDDDVAVPMRDGVRLATTVWRPAGTGVFPVLLVRTPYGKDDMGLYGNTKAPDVLALLRAGYAVAAQDVRGTSRSPGEFVPHAAEADDGVDTIAWLAAQPWCDGRIGTWGGSYQGMAQWHAAAAAPPALRAIAPLLASADPYRAPWYSPGGALSLDTFLTWANRVALTAARRTSPADGDQVKQLMSTLVDRSALLDRLPVADHPLLRELLPWAADVLDHPTRDEWWRASSPAEHYGGITAPALNIGGWYDPFLAGTIHSYVGVRRHGGSAEARDGQRLVIGPWGHADGADLGEFPDRSFGPAGSVKAANLTEAHLRFFDRWVRGRQDAVDDSTPVRIFVMGIDRWRDEPDWPLPDTRHVDYFLSSGGRAGTSGTDGALLTTVPDDNNRDTFRHDPLDPVPTLGGPVIAGPGGWAGPADQRAVRDRPDVLCFTTPVLVAPIEVTGHVRLVLHVSSSAADTDFTGKLVDVHPDGRVILLCEGIQRVRYRNGPGEAAPLRPDEPVEVVVDLCATSNVFLPGHRIGLEVASSNFPRYDRNTGTGGAVALDGEADVVVAHNTVHHGRSRPSRLVLPVVDR